MATKKTTEVALTAKNLEKMSFDDIYQMDEKEKNKQLTHTQNKEGKRLALTSKLSLMQQERIELQNNYIKSLTDPKMDSVDIRVDMLSKEQEIGIAKDIYNQLFPDSKIL